MANWAYQQPGDAANDAAGCRESHIIPLPHTRQAFILIPPPVKHAFMP